MGDMAYVPRKDFEEIKNHIEGIEEMLSVLLDNELRESIKRGKRDVEAGRVKTQDEIMRKYRVA